MAANNPNPNPNPEEPFMVNFNEELARLRRLEEQMDPAMGRIRAKTEQIAAVVNQIRGALEALTAQVTALADRIRGAQEEKARLEAEIARLRAIPDQQAQVQLLQARVDRLTGIITATTPQLTQLGDKIMALMAAADEGGITPDQVAAITRDVEAIGEQTRLLSQMLPPPPANGEAPVDQIPPPAGGGKKAKKTCDAGVRIDDDDDEEAAAKRTSNGGVFHFPFFVSCSNKSSFLWRFLRVRC